MFETGLSYFHKLGVTVLKSTFPKLPPPLSPQKKIITHRNHKNFSKDLSRDDLNDDFSLLSKKNMNLEITSRRSFTKIFIETLSKHVPIKKKCVCANHVNFVTKDLWKATILRSRLWNISLK